MLANDEFKGVNILIRDLDIIDDPSGPALSKSLADMTGQVSLSCMSIHNGHHVCQEGDQNIVNTTVSHMLLFKNTLLYQKDLGPQYLH